MRSRWTDYAIYGNILRMTVYAHVPAVDTWLFFLLPCNLGTRLVPGIHSKRIYLSLIGNRLEFLCNTVSSVTIMELEEV